MLFASGIELGAFLFECCIGTNLCNRHTAALVMFQGPNPHENTVLMLNRVRVITSTHLGLPLWNHGALALHQIQGVVRKHHGAIHLEHLTCRRSDRAPSECGTSNAVRKTKSQDKVAFWRLLTSSRQSRPADSLTVRHGWKRLADKYPDVGSSFLHKVKRVASKRRKGEDTLTLRSHSGSASSTKTMEEEMETQRHRDTNCQGHRQDTDCQGIGPESVLCFLFI